MLISLAWLSDWLGETIDISQPNKIAEQLTLQGLEVEKVIPATVTFNNVVVGEVTKLEPHPNADKLRIATVNVGQATPLQIVCGAKNVVEGGRYPTALVDAVLPGEFHIKASELRGVESNGMLCSRDEIGLSTKKNKAEGLLTLPDDAPIGKDIREYLQLDDTVLDVAITPDRGDAFSYRGIAREVLAGQGQTMPDIASIVPEQIDASQNTDLKVRVENTKACPYYLAQKITGVDNTVTTPLWLVERLRRSGIRAISPVVDVTNYVMLMLGTPLHAFDRDVIGDEIVVRMATPEDNLTLLDGKEISGQDDVLFIASLDCPLALAGIMGGARGEVSEKTTTVILESAWFSPEVMAGKARRFGLTTDASQRYERGVDFTLQSAAARLAVKLITEICGGQAEKAVIAECESEFPERRPLTLKGKKLDAVLGSRFPKRRIEPILTCLGFRVVTEEKYVYQVTPPAYRFDILDDVDLIAELARIWGYDSIADVTCTNNFVGEQAVSSMNDDEIIHHCLPQLGYSEVLTYSFVDEHWASKFGELFDADKLVRLTNPISSEMNVMRTSLIPSLVSTLQYNLNRQLKRAKLYELGQQYRQENDGFTHTSVIAGLAYGETKPLQWGYKSRLLDFFDVKGDVETLLTTLGVDAFQFVPKLAAGEEDCFHPWQSADIVIDEQRVGFVGALHPRLLADIDIEDKVFVFEINRALLPEAKSVHAHEVSKFPTVRRDIAVQLKQSVLAAEVIDAIKVVCGELLYDVTLFDVYVGRNIPRGTKSMTFALFFSDSTQTLTDERIEEVVAAVTAQLSSQFNAELRS